MSVKVELGRLREELDGFGPAAYLLTVTGDGRPHAVAVAPGWDGDDLVVDTGTGSAGNAGERPRVTLLWPPREPGGYSLIVDGVATVTPGDVAGRVALQPTSAVLHRPAPDRPGDSDCVRLLKT
jgi:hypothetical protein